MYDETIIIILALLLSAIVYAYFAICIQTIADKTKTPNGWMAWIPILNVLLMVQIAKLPFWMVILAFIPYINLIALILIWGGILDAMNLSKWTLVLFFVPLVGIFVPAYIAFAGGPASKSYY